MKILQSSFFRALCAAAVGVLLINNPDSTVKNMTVIIGIIFLLSGVLSITGWLSTLASKNKIEVFDATGNPVTRRRQGFPVVGVGSLLLGLILIIMPGLFVTSLMYVLGALTVLCAIGQFVSVIGLNHTVRVPFWMWLCPSFILLAGVVVLVKPMEMASMPLVIIGWSLILYGVSECINLFVAYRRGKATTGNGC